MTKPRAEHFRMAPYQRAFLLTLDDKARHDRAMRILARPNPDWRAVKKAHRLLRDANRAGRIARNEEMKRAWASLTPAITGLSDVFKRAIASFDAATSSFQGFRIPILPPGDEIHTIAVKPARRMGKTAAMIDAREVDYSISRIVAPSIDPRFRYDLADLDDPRLQPLRDLADERARHFRERMEADILAGRAHVRSPTRRGCRHGVWLYGDSCATCAREDAAAPSSSRHEQGDEQE